IIFITHTILAFPLHDALPTLPLADEPESAGKSEQRQHADGEPERQPRTGSPQAGDVVEADLPFTVAPQHAEDTECSECGESVGRSEEHTSELQSRENLVFRLL